MCERGHEKGFFIFFFPCTSDVDVKAINYYTKLHLSAEMRMRGITHIPCHIFPHINTKDTF